MKVTPPQGQYSVNYFNMVCSWPKPLATVASFPLAFDGCFVIHPTDLIQSQKETKNCNTNPDQWQGFSPLPGLFLGLSHRLILVQIHLPTLHECLVPIALSPVVYTCDGSEATKIWTCC